MTYDYDMKRLTLNIYSMKVVKTMIMKANWWWWWWWHQRQTAQSQCLTKCNR